MIKAFLFRASIGLLLVSPNLCLSQRIEAGSIEVSVTGGLSGGFPDVSDQDVVTELELFDPLVGLSDVSDTEWNVGGSVGAGVADNLAVRFDWVRTHLFSATINLPSFGTPFAPNGPSFDTDVNLNEFTGGIEYLIGDQTVVPFVTAGAGVARLGVDVSSEAVELGVDVGMTETEATYNLGGGFRANMNDRFGLRPALQFVHVGGTLDESFWRASFGFFVTFN